MSAAERGGTGCTMGRARPPIHGFGDRAPNPWVANPCLRVPDACLPLLWASGSLGWPLGALLGRLGGVMNCLEAIVGASWVVLGP
eukprot:6110346-Pyramimonas_sp.AAC.1